ncbi:MAG: protein-disulfide reductase DsbD family protein [Rhodoferax sp.]
MLSRTTPFTLLGLLTRLTWQTRWLLALLCAGLSGGLAANAGASLSGQSAAAVVQTPEVRAELLAYAPQGIAKGTPIEFGLLLEHQPGWHTYWKNPGDSGLATEFHWTLPPGLQASPIQWPTPRKITIGRLANFGYEGQVLLPVRVTMAPHFRLASGSKDLAVQLKASWLVCKTECIPQEGQFELRVPVEGSTAAAGHLFDAAHSATPAPLTDALEAELDGAGMVLRATGLPTAWRGKAIAAFPEAIDMFATTASASPTDQVTSDKTPSAAVQSWTGGTWSARLPLSSQATQGPETVTFLLSLNGQNVRGTARVKGTWPDRTTLREASNASSAPVSATANSTADAGTLWWALAAAFLGGLILNLMPCVFPVLAVKVLGFAQHSKNLGVPRWWIGTAYTAGTVISMLGLGALLLALRAGGEELGWGFQLQSPAVVAALALLFTLMGLQLLGLMEGGALVPDALANLQLRHPVADAALSGVLAVAVASPCTAPFMGASLGLALTLPAWQSMGIFVALGLGLALPFALLSALPQFTRWLPRPGPWMLHLRHFMAFPMAATVLWLLWVLGHLLGVDAAASLAALLWSVALILWALHLQGRSRWVYALVGMALSLILICTVGPNVLESPVLSTNSQVHAGNEEDAALWQPWSTQRVDDAMRAGHPVFVDFTAAWCITCQYNKQTTLSNSEVLRHFARKQVVLMRADWTRRDPVITQALGNLGRSGVPVYVLYQPGKVPLVLSEILSTSALHDALNAL